MSEWQWGFTAGWLVLSAFYILCAEFHAGTCPIALRSRAQKLQKKLAKTEAKLKEAEANG